MSSFAKYVGIPFVEHGRTLSGLDCWGGVKLVLEEQFGMKDLPDFHDRYTTTRDRSLPEVFIDEMRRWVRVDRPQAGDVVVMKIGGKPRHAGVVIGPNQMLSVERGTGSCIERMDSVRWAGRVEGFYRRG